MLPLCNTLNITVNELLSGKTLSGADYNEKAEENFLTLIQESAETRKKTGGTRSEASSAEYR